MRWVKLTLKVLLVIFEITAAVIGTAAAVIGAAAGS